jgi:hypothetical protein
MCFIPLAKQPSVSPRDRGSISGMASRYPGPKAGMGVSQMCTDANWCSLLSREKCRPGKQALPPRAADRRKMMGEGLAPYNGTIWLGE